MKRRRYTTKIDVITKDQKLDTIIDENGVHVDRVLNSEPDWASRVDIFGAKAMEERLLNINKQIDELDKTRLALLRLMDNAVYYKQALYEDTEHVLPVVSDIFSSIYDTDIKAIGDYFVLHEADIDIVVTVVSTEKTIGVKHVDMAKCNLELYTSSKTEDEKSAKAVLIANGERLTPIDDRQDVNTALAESEETSGVLVIPTFALLRLYEMYVDKDIQRPHITNILRNKSGVIDMSETEEEAKAEKIRLGALSH